jgi:hypothetical protein
MRNIQTMLVTIFILMLLTSSALNGQEKKVKIVLKDETQYFGKITHEDFPNVTIGTGNDLTIKVPICNITLYDTLSNVIHSETEYKPDPNSHRLFFAPTAKPIPAGKGSLSIIEIFFPAISVGIADIVSLNGGVSILPTGIAAQLVYMASKITFFQSNNFAVAAGLGYANIVGSFGLEKGGGVLYYGVGTYGGENKSITVGGGFFDLIGTTPPSEFLLLIGGEIRTSKSIKLITENYIIPADNFALASIGIRFFGKHLAGDFGLFTTIQEKERIPIFPWIGFAYNF